MDTTATHEDAPATAMLATHCAACARPLVDAVSVEANMGPICRRKYGVADGASDADRAAANVIVARIARQASGLTDDDVLGMVGELRALGFEALADRITDRVVGAPKVSISVEGRELILSAPYHGANGSPAVDVLRTVPGRWWCAATQTNRFPARSKNALWAALQACYPGAAAVGPKGRFEIPNA
ncbi:MAG: DUF6011 domain-containing protein [Alphaproteobacteria bacterium]